MINKFNILIILLLLPVCVSAQEIDKARLDTFFDLLDENNRGMGTVSVYIDGKEAYNRSIGFSEIAGNVKADALTKYRIGSITKTFTATMIMQVIEKGELELSTYLSTFYPDIPNADSISIEDLLRHRSGLFNITSAPDFAQWMEKGSSKQEMLNRFKKNGTVFEPGAKFEYSNTNYILLGYILEDIEKRPYPEILASLITGPCLLENTYYGGKIGTKENEAFSYTPGYPWDIATETDSSLPHGAGALVSTPTDVNKFLLCLFNGKLISAASLEKMKTIVDGYGLGIFQFPFHEHQAFGHNGGIDGFNTSAGYFPKEDVAVAYFSNGTRYPVNNVMIGVLSNVFDVPFEMPEFTEISAEILDRYVGVYENPELPIDLTISRSGSQLMGQATGQPSFPLTAVDQYTFKFDQAGISVIFTPDDDKLSLKQGGGTYEMTRKEE